MNIISLLGKDISFVHWEKRKILQRKEKVSFCLELCFIPFPAIKQFVKFESWNFHIEVVIFLL